MTAHGLIRSVFFDIDGTLDDSNDLHAQAWVETFAESGRSVPFEEIRPLIGMGGDKLLATLDVGVDADSDAGKALTERRKALFLERYVGRVVAFPGARELVQTFREAGLQCIVASSATPQELTPLLDIAGVRDLFEQAVEPDEIEGTKPEPDIVLAALKRTNTNPENALMIGDTSYDIDAAHQAGVRCVALRCGGSSSEALAQADAVFDDPLTLADALARTTIDAILNQGA